MKDEEIRNQIQDAAENFVTAIQEITGERQCGIFYGYYLGDERVAGYKGQMDHWTRLGFLEEAKNLINQI